MECVVHHSNQHAEGNKDGTYDVGSHKYATKLGYESEVLILHWNALLLSTTTKQQPEQDNESVGMSKKGVRTKCYLFFFFIETNVIAVD